MCRQLFCVWRLHYSFHKLYSVTAELRFLKIPKPFLSLPFPSLPKNLLLSRQTPNRIKFSFYKRTKKEKKSPTQKSQFFLAHASFLHMIAAISSPTRTATPGPGSFRISNPNRHSFRFSNSGFPLWKRKLNWLSYERIQQMQMAWFQSMSGGCFKSTEPPPKQRTKVEEDCGGQDVFDADAMDSKVSPEHLVIMVNGLIGSAADWRFAAEQFVKKLPDRVIVHRSECNYSKLTFDGVDMMGERLAQEVLDVVKHWPEVRKISFVAHSLGGLVARYAIGRLYEHSSELGRSGFYGNSLTEEHTNSSMQYLEQPCEDRIAGLQPMNFITFATPHLGSRGHKQLPLLCGLPFLEKRASQTAHLVVGRSGKHLFLTDSDEGKPPLLLRMVDDSDDLKFISALCAFKRRVAYANANYDHMVGWRTSSIRRQNELPKSNLVIDEKYPHVVYVERETTNTMQNKASSIAGAQTDIEELMIQGLTQVPWERVDVSFQKSNQRYVAHNTIQARHLIYDNNPLKGSQMHKASALWGPLRDKCTHLAPCLQRGCVPTIQCYKEIRVPKKT